LGFIGGIRVYKNGQRLAVDHKASFHGNTSSAPMNDGEELL
jgi:hypothetical protein